MDEVNAQVVQGFSLKSKGISKSKYMYICKTDKGVKIIRPTATEQNKLLLISELQQHLIRNGFKNIDRYHTSVQNKPFYVYNGATYIMTDYIEYPESDLTNLSNVKNIILSVAKFHKLCQNVISSEDNYIESNSDILNQYIKKTSRLKNLKKFASNQSHLSDFDVMFIKNFDYFYNEAYEACQLLKNSKYNYLMNTAQKNRMICHNCLKEENLLSSQDGIYITNFNNCTLNHFILDLCEFINRYIRKHGNDYYRISDIVELYDSVNPLNQNILEVLYALLKFPDKYIKICESYYNKRRSWTPNSVANRFELIIEQKKHHFEYIQELKTI